MTRAEVFAQYPPHLDVEEINTLLAQELSQCNRKIVVLDDDPTGIQTVHGISVYTDWSKESFDKGFSNPDRLFFVLTNSRAFSEEETIKVHTDIGKALATHKKGYVLISRSDSTLRGHFPLETKVLKETIEENSDLHFDGEIMYPFFPEGGRYTASNIHYVETDGKMIPAGQTEFAKDKTFSYKNSDLAAYVEEKTKGEFLAEDVISISLKELREQDYDSITKKLLLAENFSKIIVNSLTYDDVKVFTIAFLRALAQGKNYMFRGAAGIVKVLGGISDKPLITKEEFAQYGNHHGGLVIVGSHVGKTTKQLEILQQQDGIEFIELNQHLVLDQAKFKKEIARVIQKAEENITAGRTAVVFTRRDRLDVESGDPEDELRLATEISEGITSIVDRLSIRPSFLIAKGGITSSSIGTDGLHVKEATVMGQILPGVPVWLTGEESKFPELPYVIFPGNVGDDDALVQAIAKLKSE